ncbi:helix-turn-helix domain-containing protein [Actinomyces marmotae]|uniref:Helix-turn-helix domain-containing protein n=2 Tax=Actinomycetaceae TaxID=2049 RepID=A0A6M8BAI9_9ACTO|nr:helix-turn-helix domain-containing protein [Actinomyces marmotae]
MSKHALNKRSSLSSVEAAAILGVSRDTVVRAADRGEIPVRRTPGGQRRFNPDDVEAYRARLASVPQVPAALAASSGGEAA